MIPPICEICYRKFNPDKEGDLVYFKKTKKGEEFEEKAKEEGFVGHPPDATWFCGDHLEEAKKLTHLTIDEAVGMLK
jgi:hypothetical protein